MVDPSVRQRCTSPLRPISLISMQLLVNFLPNNRLVVASEISGSLWEILNPPLGAATFGGHLCITYFKVQGEEACP